MLSQGSSSLSQWIHAVNRTPPTLASLNRKQLSRIGNNIKFPRWELHATLRPANLEGAPMKVVGRNRLQAFGVRHPDAREWLKNWLAEAELAVWETPHDVRAQYASVSFLGSNTAVFNVTGNHYRLEVTIAYQTKVVVIIWIGTHSEYDKRNRNR